MTGFKTLIGGFVRELVRDCLILCHAGLFRRANRIGEPQLQAINAGQTPSFRENGGSVTNVSIGDINVPAASNPTQNGREIAGVLNWEIRRGTARLD